eukprot:3914836-Amphidinium_carterae.1
MPLLRWVNVSDVVQRVTRYQNVGDHVEIMLTAITLIAPLVNWQVDLEDEEGRPKVAVVVGDDNKGQEAAHQGEHYEGDYAQDYEEEYEEGATWPEEEQEVPQYDGATAYLQPILESPYGHPSAFITTPEEKTLTRILDTGASHCLLPVAHLTAEEVELASRVHLRIANGTLTRALMYQNIIYAKRVPRPLVSVGQVTHSLPWVNLPLEHRYPPLNPTMDLHEEGKSYEVLQATLWNALPCITDV